MLLKWYFSVINDVSLLINLWIGKCNEFYFTFSFEIWMWIWIYWIFERDWIFIRYLSNKSNLNIDKQNIFCVEYAEHFFKLTKGFIAINFIKFYTKGSFWIYLIQKFINTYSQQYEESVVDKFKSNLLLMIIWLNIINYNS